MMWIGFYPSPSTFTNTNIKTFQICSSTIIFTNYTTSYKFILNLPTDTRVGHRWRKQYPYLVCDFQKSARLRIPISQIFTVLSAELAKCLSSGLDATLSTQPVRLVNEATGWLFEDRTCWYCGHRKQPAAPNPFVIPNRSHRLFRIIIPVKNFAILFFSRIKNCYTPTMAPNSKFIAWRCVLNTQSKSSILDCQRILYLPRLAVPDIHFAHEPPCC